MEEKYIDWDCIFSFMSLRWGTTKKKIAKKLHCDAAKLSRTSIKLRPEEIQEFYKMFFQLNADENGEEIYSEAKQSGEHANQLLGAFKNFLNDNGYTSDATIIEENINASNYKKIMKELLRRANMHRETVSKTSKASSEAIKSPVQPTMRPALSVENNVNTNMTPTEQMHEIFEQAIRQYNIEEHLRNVGDYLVANPVMDLLLANGSPLSVDFSEFSYVINRDVLEKFSENKNDSEYVKIAEFKIAVESYCSLVSKHPASDVFSHYGYMWNAYKNYDEIYEAINNTKSELLAEKDQLLQMERQAKLSLSRIEKEIEQLNAIETIFCVHQKLYALCGDVCLDNVFSAYWFR